MRIWRTKRGTEKQPTIPPSNQRLHEKLKKGHRPGAPNKKCRHTQGKLYNGNRNRKRGTKGNIMNSCTLKRPRKKEKKKMQAGPGKGTPMGGGKRRRREGLWGGPRLKREKS